MAKYLVIVESPAKVKTIKKFLGKNYEVTASNGHVRDLPKSQMGIDFEHDFEPKYITIRGKGEILAKLRKEVKKADRVYLATDPDREGEAISWHLSKALKLDEKADDKKVFRISFNEITKNAVKASLKTPREIDMDLVNAQQAGLALAASFPVSPLSPLYPADLVREYDRDETLAALRAAGQDTGETRELVLLVNEEDRFRLTSAQFIAEHLSLLDWHITVRQLPWEDYLAALAAGEFDLYYGEVRLTADWDLRDLTGTGGALNYGHWSHPDTSRLLQELAGAEDRTAAMRSLCAHLKDQAPILPVCFKSTSVLTQAEAVEGLDPTAAEPFYALGQCVIHLQEP